MKREVQIDYIDLYYFTVHKNKTSKAVFFLTKGVFVTLLNTAIMVSCATAVFNMLKPCFPPFLGSIYRDPYGNCNLVSVYARIFIGFLDTNAWMVVALITFFMDCILISGILAMLSYIRVAEAEKWYVSIFKINPGFNF